MTSPDTAQSVEQLAETWRAFVLDYGSIHARQVGVQDVSGLAIRWADSKFGFWNAVTLTDVNIGLEVLRERLGAAAEYMRGRTHPGFLWLFEGLLDPSARAGLAEAANQAGLTLGLRGFGMAGDILPLPEPAHPNLRFVRVTSEDELTAYADLNSRAYGLPLEQGRDALCGSEYWKSDVHAYLGLVDDVPVPAAATVRTGDCLFLALVATAPEAQRCGYGEATTRKALYEGAKSTGLTRATLHASLAGAPVYERIGYRKVTDIGFWALKERD